MRITETQLRKMVRNLVEQAEAEGLNPVDSPVPTAPVAAPTSGLVLKVKQAPAGWIAQYKCSLGYGGHLNKYADQSGGWQPTRQQAIDATMRTLKKMAMKVQQDIDARQKVIDDLEKVMTEIQSPNPQTVGD